MFRRISRRRDFYGTPPDIYDESTGMLDGEALEESPLETPDTVFSEPVEAPDTLLSEPSTAQLAPAPADAPSASPEPARPMLDTAAAPAPDVPVSPPESAEAVRERRARPARHGRQVWCHRRDLIRSPSPSCRSAKRSPGSSQSTFEPAQTMVGESAPFGTAPVVPSGPTWGNQGASRRPKHRRRLKRLTIAAMVIISLELAVGIPVWLGWVGGLSAVFGLGSSTVGNTTSLTGLERDRSKRQHSGHRRGW